MTPVADAPPLAAPGKPSEVDPIRRSYRRAALVLATLATLPFGWGEGVDGCAGGIPRVRTGLDVARGSGWPVLLALLLAPLVLGLLAGRAKRTFVRIALFGSAMLVALLDVLLVAALESMGTERQHRMLAGAAVALGAQALLFVDMAAAFVAAIGARLGERRPHRAALDDPAPVPGPARRALARIDGRTGSPLALIVVPLVAAALALVERGRITPVAALWQRGELPHGGTFQAGVGGEDALLLAGTLDSLHSGVTRVDMATGRTAWALSDARQVMLGETPDEPVWVVMAETGAIGTELVEIDGRTGHTLRSTHVESRSARWHRRGAVLLALESTHAARVDPDTGRVIWSTRPDEPIDEFRPILRDRSVEVPCGSEHRALCSFALADGRLITRRPEVVSASAPRPAGPLYVLGPSSVSAWTGDDHPVWSSALPAGYQGTRLVASERWVVVLAATDARPNPEYLLRALAAADGRVAWERHNEPGGYLAFIAADGDLAAYFTSVGATLRVRDLGRGREVPVRQFSGRLVISPDATGTSPAVPGGDPFVFGRYVVVPDFDQWCAARVEP
ncbi:MAG: PQQ-binding-like beta-propeller repeat protein [Polyangiaceae bacterium]